TAQNPTDMKCPLPSADRTIMVEPLRLNLPIADELTKKHELSFQAAPGSFRQQTFDAWSAHFSNASACLLAASVWPPNIRATSVTRSAALSKAISEMVRPALSCLIAT